ncbi:MAG: type III-B CRISPR module-associated Cmr3 family protein [Syntrophobacteria bacterium]
MPWYVLTPEDTLFFRGGEPMVMGESHFQTSIFPPSPETLAGAVRAKVIQDHAAGDFNGYMSGRYSDEPWYEEIGGPEAVPDTLKLNGPFLYMNESLLFPVPANLYRAKGRAGETLFNACRPKRFKEVRTKFGLSCVCWLPNREGVAASDWALVDGYITAKGISSYLSGKLDQLTDDDIYDHQRLRREGILLEEERVGIARHRNLRVARSGHLYQTRHWRLGEGVGLAFLLEGVSSFGGTGCMQLGGEGRRVWITEAKISLPEAPKRADFVVTLFPIPILGVMDGFPITPVSDGERSLTLPKQDKIPVHCHVFKAPLEFGGWDMKNQRPKPMRAYLPGGSVFFFKNTEITSRCNHLVGGCHDTIK